jgi:methylaspartate mutase epsilon subunit
MDEIIRRRKIDEDEFMKMRPQVLGQWPTGKEVDLEEAVEYQQNLPEKKKTIKVIEKLHKEGKSCLLPRTGTPLLETQIKMCQKLVNVGSPIIVLTFDSFTREGLYERVEQGIQESEKEGRAKLNGYPMINLGVKKSRKIIESCECAFNTRVGWVCGPLGAEISLASGVTSLGNAGAVFLYFGCYHKTQKLEEFIKYHQYIWRLMGYYADRNIIITTDDHGWQPGFVFPYDVSIACTILDSLMMAQQGVKSIIPHIEGHCHLWQDIAIVRVGRKLTRYYLDKFGYKDVDVTGVLNGQLPLYPVPQGIAELYAYSNYSAMIQALSECELTFVRTLDEGVGIPSEEALELSNRSAKWIVDVIREQKIHIESKEIDIEEEMTAKTVKAIVDRVLEVGDGDPINGSIKAIEAGILDSPMSPNINVKDKVSGIRDAQGAVRYLDFGNLPIPEEVKEFNREKLAERAKIQGRVMDYKAATEDFWAPSQGSLVGKMKRK